MRHLAHYILVLAMLTVSVEPVLRGLAPRGRSLAEEPKHSGPPAPPSPDQVAPVAAAAEPTKPGVAAGATPTDPYTALVRSFFDDQDPLILYFALPALTFMRFVALFDLFNSVPNAWKAGAELSNWKFNAAERAKIKATIKAMRSGANHQLRALERAGNEYQNRLSQVEILFRELKSNGRIAGDRKTRDRLYDALEVWHARGEFGPLAAFVKSEREGRLRFADGKTWLKKFDLWTANEQKDAKVMVDRWNDLTAVMNKGLAVGEQKPNLHLEDVGRSRNPGELYLNGIHRLKTADASKSALALCQQVFRALLDRRLEFRGKVGALGLVNQGQKMLQPVASLGFSGLVFWLHAKAYKSSIDRYGKTPEVARAEKAQEANIANAVNLRAESSLDSQVARRKDEMAPFIDVIAANLQDHSEELMTVIKEYSRLNPDADINLNAKRAMLLDKDQLRAKVMQAMPFASQVIGKETTVDQLLSFLALATKEKTQVSSEEDHKRFLNALYGQIVNNLFSEIVTTVEFDGNLVTVGASNNPQISALIKSALTPRSFAGMKAMKIVAPENVAPLPVLPDKKVEAKPPEAPKAKGSLSMAPEVGVLTGTEFVSTPR